MTPKTNDRSVKAITAELLTGLALVTGLAKLSRLELARLAKPQAGAEGGLTAQVLGALRDPEAEPALITLLGDTSGSVRREAADALGAIGGAEAVPTLIEALTDEDRRVRSSAAEALGAIGDTRAIPGLIKALKNEHEYGGGGAVGALAQIGLPAVPALIEALKDWTEINEHNDESAVSCAARALEQIGPPAVPALISVFKDGDADWSLRYRTAGVLGGIADPQAAPILAECLGETVLGENAAGALVRIGPPAVPALLQALKNGDPEMREQATEVLTGIVRQRPDPALRAALPSLRRLQKRAPIFREALDQIEAATAAFRDLPLPVAAPPPEARSLPRPAAAADVPLADVPPPPRCHRRAASGCACAGG